MHRTPKHSLLQHKQGPKTGQPSSLKPTAAPQPTDASRPLIQTTSLRRPLAIRSTKQCMPSCSCTTHPICNLQPSNTCILEAHCATVQAARMAAACWQPSCCARVNKQSLQSQQSLHFQQGKCHNSCINSWLRNAICISADSTCWQSAPASQQCCCTK